MRQPCCPNWSKAREEETDNEGYGRLLGPLKAETEFGEWPLGWYVGSPGALAPIKFCPWCGATVDPPDNDEVFE